MDSQKNVLVFNNMPRVINKVTFITESNALMDEVKKIISSDNSILDFNKIYPIPDFKEYDYKFTLYHILYKLASMGIEKHVKDYLPRRSVATNEYRYVDGIYLDTVRRLSREMKVTKNEARFLEVTTKERIIAHIRAIASKLIGIGEELPKGYHDFKNFESKEFIKAIEDNADFYFNNLLKYGVIFKLSWYTFYWGEEKALSAMWLNSNTIKFYTRFSNVLPLLIELSKKIACMNIGIEYKYIHLDLPSKAFKYNINYLGAHEVTLSDNEKVNIYNELTK